MPLYEYRCCDCNATFEALVREGKEAVCPHCGGSSLDKLPSAPFVLSGQTACPAGHTCCGRQYVWIRLPCYLSPEERIGNESIIVGQIQDEIRRPWPTQPLELGPILWCDLRLCFPPQHLEAPR